MLKMMKMDFNTRVGSFCVDTVDEIEKLPTLNTPGQDNLNTVYCAGMGSDCLVISDASVYILNGDNKWVELGAGGGGSALSFLPHPEGIFAYWDYAHGVSTTEWVDQLNNETLTCNSSGSFSVEDNTIKIIGDSNDINKVGANLNLSKNDFFVFYFVLPLNKISYVCSSIVDTGKKYLEGIEGLNYSTTTNQISFWYGGSRKLFAHNFRTSTVFAFIKTPNSGRLILNDKVQDVQNISSFTVTDNFGLSYNKPITSLLLSTETNNVDYIQENLKVLEEKYFPA